MKEVSILPLIGIVLSIVAMIYLVQHLEEIEPLIVYSPNELMGKAMYCNDQFCPQHGYEYGTFGTINGEEACFCGNESEDGTGWVTEKIFYLNGTLAEVRT